MDNLQKKWKQQKKIVSYCLLDTSGVAGLFYI